LVALRRPAGWSGWRISSIMSPPNDLGPSSVAVACTLLARTVLGHGRARSHRRPWWAILGRIARRGLHDLPRWGRGAENSIGWAAPQRSATFFRHRPRFGGAGARPADGQRLLGGRVSADHHDGTILFSEVGAGHVHWRGRRGRLSAFEQVEGTDRFCERAAQNTSPRKLRALLGGAWIPARGSENHGPRAGDWRCPWEPTLQAGPAGAHCPPPISVGGGGVGQISGGGDIQIRRSPQPRLGHGVRVSRAGIGRHDFFFFGGCW